MPDVPLVVLVAIVWAYWLIVGAMMIRLRRKNRKLVGLVPEQRRALYVARMGSSLQRGCSCLMPPPRVRRAFRAAAVCVRPGYVVVRCRGRRRAGRLVASIDCWRRMGDDWRMTSASADRARHRGLFQRIRHPIYAFSMLLIVCSALIVLTPPMTRSRRASDADEHQGTQSVICGRAWGQLSTVRRTHRRFFSATHVALNASSR